MAVDPEKLFQTRRLRCSPRIAAMRSRPPLRRIPERALDEAATLRDALVPKGRVKAASSLRDYENAEFATKRVANTLPTTWKEAIRAYVDDRTEQVKSMLFSLSHTTEWAAKDISYQCAALEEISKRLTDDLKGDKKRFALKIAAPDKRAQLQHDIDLAGLLCPWAGGEAYLPTLQKIRSEAETEILQQKNIRANQALGSEVDELLRFLQRTEEAGHQGARGDGHREADRCSPRPQGKSGAVRLVM